MKALPLGLSLELAVVAAILFGVLCGLVPIEDRQMQIGTGLSVSILSMACNAVGNVAIFIARNIWTGLRNPENLVMVTAAVASLKVSKSTAEELQRIAFHRNISSSACSRRPSYLASPPDSKRQVPGPTTSPVSAVTSSSGSEEMKGEHTDVVPQELLQRLREERQLCRTNLAQTKAHLSEVWLPHQPRHARAFTHRATFFR